MTITIKVTTRDAMWHESDSNMYHMRGLNTYQDRITTSAVATSDKGSNKTPAARIEGQHQTSRLARLNEVRPWQAKKTPYTRTDQYMQDLSNVGSWASEQPLLPSSDELSLT
jgi:hypothetical protein